MNRSKTIAVTGGLGFIGSHTVVELIHSGFTPVIIDNLSNSSIKVLDGIERITKVRPTCYILDVLNTKEVETILKNHNVEAVIHFAAFKAVGESVLKPLDYYQNNVSGLLSLIKAMKETDISQLVFSSSCTVYGQPKVLPVTEKSALAQAESPYGNTKKIGEELLMDVSKTGFKTISLRYFNPVGAHPTAFIGELPLGVPNNLVPFITQTAAGWREHLTVFGNDYNTHDGTCIRDYIHVVDLAIAHVKAIKYLETSPLRFDAFNIGTGNGYTVLDVIKAFEEATHLKLNYKIGMRREGDIEKVWADCKKANTELGWEATLNLNQMMKDAWHWQCQLSNSI